MNPDQEEELREKLLCIVSSGLSAKAIAKKTNITYDILAKFKQGKLYLTPRDFYRLEKFLGQVHIPTSI